MSKKTGRPPNECIPEFIVEFATENYGSVRAFCLAMGKNANWIKELFDDNQTRLLPYIKLADYAGVSLFDLVVLIEEGKMATFLDGLKKKLAERNNEPTCTSKSLAEDIGVSEGLIHNLYQETKKLKGLNSYWLLAKHMNCSPDLFRKDRIESTSSHLLAS